MATFRVRKGFIYTDTSGAKVRPYGEGEELVLAIAVGDAAHALQRVTASSGSRGQAPRRKKKGVDDGDE